MQSVEWIRLSREVKGENVETTKRQQSQAGSLGPMIRRDIERAEEVGNDEKGKENMNKMRSVMQDTEN